MNYSFGWWDFTELDGQPQMVCRDSNERVVMVDELADPWLSKAGVEHPKHPADRWKRFEYHHEDFWFPLVVNWVPEEGKILVDYNLSSELWRLETNAKTECPPYDAWVCVDDMVPDALWCWPEVFFKSADSRRYSGERDWSITSVGKWFSGCWEPYHCSRETITANHWWIDSGAYSEDYLDENYGGYRVNNWHPNKSEKQTFKRELKNYLQSQSTSGWLYCFDTIKNAQQLLNDLGSRIILPSTEQFYLDHDGYKPIYGEILLNDKRRRPFLLRRDGRQVIVLTEANDYFYGPPTRGVFALFSDEVKSAQVFQLCASSLYTNQWKQTHLAISSGIPCVQEKFELCDAKLKFPEFCGSVDNGPERDLEISQLASLLRTAGEAFQFWEGVSPLDINANQAPTPIEDSFIRNIKRLKELPKWRYLLGYQNLYLTMEFLSGTGFSGRHRQLIKNWQEIK